jgi:hypothetical protein
LSAPEFGVYVVNIDLDAVLQPQASRNALRDFVVYCPVRDEHWHNRVSLTADS